MAAAVHNIFDLSNRLVSRTATLTVLLEPRNATAGLNSAGGGLSTHDLSVLFISAGATVGGCIAVVLVAFGVIMLFLKARKWLKEKSYRRESQLSELASSYSVGNYFYDYRDLEEDAATDIESVKNDNFLRTLEEGI